MKTFIILTVLATCAALVACAPADKDAVVVKAQFDNIGVDGYNSEYETSNGIKSQEQGQLQNAGSENEYMLVRGQYSYLAPDGQIFTVTYEAGPDGFKPQGDHLPVGP